MIKIRPDIILSIGIALLVSGILTFLYGFGIQGQISFFDFWGVRILPQNISFFGGLLAAVGSALTAFGILAIRSRKSE